MVNESERSRVVRSGLGPMLLNMFIIDIGVGINSQFSMFGDYTTLCFIVNELLIVIHFVQNVTAQQEVHTIG